MFTNKRSAKITPIQLADQSAMSTLTDPIFHMKWENNFLGYQRFSEYKIFSFRMHSNSFRYFLKKKRRVQFDYIQHYFLKEQIACSSLLHEHTLCLQKLFWLRMRHAFLEQPCLHNGYVYALEWKIWSFYYLFSLVRLPLSWADFRVWNARLLVAYVFGGFWL